MIIATAYAAEAAAEHGGHEAFYLDPHFWVTVAFFLVVGAAWRPVSAGLKAALDARSAKIRARLEEAERLREEAQEMLVHYRRKQHEVTKDAEEIIARARAEADRLAAHAEKELTESLARRERMAIDRIAAAEAQAIKDVRALAAEVAVTAAGRLLAEKLAPHQASDLVDGAIRDLAGKFN